MACKPAEPVPAATIYLAICALATVLACLVVVDARSDWRTPASIIVLMGSYYVSMPLAIVIHEFGHALAGLMVGHRIYLIQLGYGRSLKTFRLGHARVVVGWRQSGGHVVGFPLGAERRWRESVFVAGGAAANLLASVVLFYWAVRFGVWYASLALQCLGLACAGAGMANLFMAGRALWPGSPVTDGTSRANDGRLLLNLWRQPAPGPGLGRLAWQGYALLRERRWSRAEAHFESVLAQYPDNMTFRGPLIHIIEQSRGPAAAFAYYREHRSQFENSTGEVDTAWAYAWGNTAWVALHEITPDTVSLADRFSALALAADPSSPPIRATRGAVLMAMDRREEGRQMLLIGLRDLDDPPFKVDLCRYLAKDAKAHGQAEEFQAYRALADHLQATSPPLR